MKKSLISISIISVLGCSNIIKKPTAIDYLCLSPWNCPIERIDSCIKDNRITFFKNKTMLYDVGKLKCDGEGEKNITDKWTIDNDGKILGIFRGMNFDIISLDSNFLRFTIRELGDGKIHTWYH